MNNKIKMTIKVVIIVMIPTFLLEWGVIIKCCRGEKHQVVKYDPP